MEENNRESLKKEKNKAAALKRYYDNKEKILLYSKEYYKLNKKKKLNESKERYNKNKEKIKEYSKIYQKENYEKNKQVKGEYFKKYKKNNKKTLSKYYKNYIKKRREEDVVFRLKDKFRSIIGGAIKKKGYLKNKTTEFILGCTFNEFKIYIESKFELWMNWENHGVYSPNGIRTWQIDHIIPLASAQTEEEVIKLNHHTNLRPLCSKENNEKGGKIII